VFLVSKSTYGASEREAGREGGGERQREKEREREGGRERERESERERGTHTHLNTCRPIRAETTDDVTAKSIGGY